VRGPERCLVLPRVALSYAAYAGEGESVSGGSNKRMIRRHYEGLWNRWHHPAVADELISADTVFRDPLGVAVRGLESCGTKNLSSHHMV